MYQLSYHGEGALAYKTILLNTYTLNIHTITTYGHLVTIKKTYADTQEATLNFLDMIHKTLL